ncbi:peroxidase-related enzyme [Desulfogranum marinum]|uniref:peroxidase-related enzyme n=1 Tax=Desulfogranum marinum TaxID=453220 RepID=UPI001962A701|nr:peroxidase-related enzyme [Desulfogranum marinum]MBM9515170.1 peroxidase-related enzyme [Desulfogranum marinum]
MTATKTNISRYPVPTIDDMPEDIKEACLGFKEKLGFIPNVLVALAHRPDEFRAFLAYNNALMNKESGLTPADKEMIIIAHSNHNGCSYCVQSHGAALRLATENPTIADQVAVNYHEADITPRQKAMIDFAMKVTTDSRSINESDFATLRTHGLSDEDIWDIAGITAFFNLSNRMMNFAAIRPDDEFYMLGRH